MGFRLARTLVLLAAASLLLISIAACNDDDDSGSDATATPNANEELSLYFGDLAAIQNELNEGIQIIDGHADAAFVDPAAARQTLNAVSVAGQAALKDLNEVDVPAEAADAHAALENAGEAYLSAVDGLADELQTVEPGDEFTAFLDGINAPGSEYEQAKADLQTACADMQTVADDNDIDVTVKCPV